jgi:hypothetical protein
MRERFSPRLSSLGQAAGTVAHTAPSAVSQLTAALLAAFVVPPAHAASVGLQWDPVTNDPAVTGYQILYGTSSGRYDSSVEASSQGAATSSQRVTNLKPGHTYYFAVRSHDAGSRTVSKVSNEVSATVPGPNPQPGMISSEAGEWVPPAKDYRESRAQRAPNPPRPRGEGRGEGSAHGGSDLHSPGWR